MAEVVLDEVVVVAQVNAERMAVQAVERAREPFVVELHRRVELISLPLGTHLPEHIQRRLAPVVHPAILVVVVAVGLILEAVAYLVSHSLTAARGMGPVRERQQTYHVVNAAAAGLPLGGVAQADNHLIGVRLRLTLIDGDELQAVGIELKNLVGSAQDGSHRGRHTGAVASLPEQYPVLRLQAAVVAPLAGGILQLGISATGVGTAVDSLVDTCYAVPELRRGGGQLTLGQGIVGHGLAGRLESRLQGGYRRGLAGRVLPPADDLLGVVDALL